MDKIYLKQALAAIEPKSKAARVRELMPVIEQKVAQGVGISEILAVLNTGGLALTEATLKSYLYRYRKKQQGKASRETGQPVSSEGAESLPPAEVSEGISKTAARPEHVEHSKVAVSIQELDRVMKPDPAQQAAELAHYEHLAKNQRRSSKP